MSGLTRVAGELKQNPGSWPIMAAMALVTTGLALQVVSPALALSFAMAFMVLFALGMARIIPWLDDSGQSSSLTITPPASALPATSSLKSRQPQSTEPVRETVIVTPTRSVRLQCAQGPEGGDIAFIVERSEAETGVALLLGAGDSVHDFPVLRP